MEKLQKTLLVLALMGLFISSYLVYHHYTVVASGLNAEWCNVNTDVNCDVVAASKYSEVYGIPVAIIGLLWFIVVVVLAFPFADRILKNKSHLFLLGWSVLGTIGIASLIRAEFVLGVWCIACTLTHAAGFGIFSIALINYKIHRKVRDGDKS